MSLDDGSAWNLDQSIEVEAKDEICKLHCCVGIFGILLKYNILVNKDEFEILHKGWDVGLCLRLEVMGMEVTWHLQWCKGFGIQLYR